MKIDIDHLLKDQKELIDCLHLIGEEGRRANLETYIVGGIVRDAFMGRPVTDLDIVVTGDGLDFADRVARALHAGPVVKFHPFGTAMIPYKHIQIEIATARKETYRTDSRKPDVVFTDLTEDLRRRDFTINAMAVDIRPDHYGEFKDPFNGIRDLKVEVIRTPFDPEETFFDDPLRMLRAIRFATRFQYRISDDTFNAIKKTAERIQMISMERIRDELLKILMALQPSMGFILMENAGLLPLILPEISGMKGVEEKNGYGHKDVFYHTLKVVDNVCKMTDSMTVRLAALFHDVGKPPTKRFLPNQGWTFHGHEDVGARMFDTIGRHLKLPIRQIKEIRKLIRLHLRPIAIAGDEVTDSAVRRLRVEAGDAIHDLLTLCRADITSKNPEKIREYQNNFDEVEKRIQVVEEKDRLRAFQSPVRGQELMEFYHIPPGPLVGKIKSLIENAILDGEIPNEYEAAKAWLVDHKDTVLEKARKALSGKSNP
ncbi:MAG: CCA tRNA nucleotidyltransferase [Fidelibacterota bacterium]